MSECSVCYFDIEWKESKKCKVCFNSFHKCCLKKWFKLAKDNQFTCPTCRGLDSFKEMCLLIPNKYKFVRLVKLVCDSDPDSDSDF